MQRKGYGEGMSPSTLGRGLHRRLHPTAEFLFNFWGPEMRIFSGPSDEHAMQEFFKVKK